MSDGSTALGMGMIVSVHQPSNNRMNVMQATDELLRRKVKHIRSTNARVVATGNPGCLLQVVNGCKREGVEVRVVRSSAARRSGYRRRFAVAHEGSPLMQIKKFLTVFFADSLNSFNFNYICTDSFYHIVSFLFFES